jgi:MoaA/NifB/PqqE/SkfB family radical SAM enzyme
MNRILDKIGSPELDWIQVEVTSRCNAACIYCPQPFLGRKQHMPFGLFQNILPYLGYTDLVYLQGWGEPLLNPDLFSMIRACKAKGKHVGFTTNGMLLTDETICRLIDLGTDIISVSLAGATPATHDRIRKGTDLVKIIENIEYMQQAKAQKKARHPEIHFSYVMLASNLNELQETVGLAKRLGVEQIVGSHLTWIQNKSLLPEALFNREEEQQGFSGILEATVAEAEKENLTFAFNSPVLQKQSTHCTENICRSCVVSVNGDVGPCVFTSSTLLQENGHPLVHMFQNSLEPCYPVSFGNIAHESLTRIWEKKAYHRFRNLHDPAMTLPGNPPLPLPQSCRSCYKKEV